MPLNLSDILTGADPKPEFVIDGLVYAGQTLVIAGEPGVGKSFLQYYLSMCVAGGLLALDRPVVQGRVLYFDEENSRPDLCQYLRWIWRGLDRPSIAILQQNLFLEHFSLATAGNRWRYMHDAAQELQPKLIVLDTVTPCCGIEDENDNSEASVVMQRLHAVKGVAQPGCALVLLKHAKFSHDPNERQTIRGAKTWLGAADGVLFHKRMHGRPRGDQLYNSVITPDKVRAFGLKRELVISPSWTSDEGERGIVLEAEQKGSRDGK